MIEARHDKPQEPRSKQIEQAVKLSAEKYCSASIMLGKVAEITHDFEVVEG